MRPLPRSNLQRKRSKNKALKCERVVEHGLRSEEGKSAEPSFAYKLLDRNPDMWIAPIGHQHVLSSALNRQA